MSTLNLPDFFRKSIRDLANVQRLRDRTFADIFDRRDGFMPACDIEEGEKQYTMSIDLPGMRREDIHVDLKGALLTIRGERKNEHTDRSKDHLRSERYYGSFERSFQLPAEMAADEIEAQYADGVLVLNLPKSEAVKPKQIRIGEAKKASPVKVA